MKILYICIGNELLRGTTVNKNMAIIGGKILDYNLQLTHQITINDDFDEIKNAIKNNLEKYDIIITTGGLGPTVDDITKNAIAEALDLSLTQNLEAKKDLEILWKKRGYGEICEKQLQQSYFPEGAILFKNKNGSAPGCQINYKNSKTSCTIFIFPGPPVEMQPMLEAGLLPFLEKISQNDKICNCYYLSDLPESKAENVVEKMLNDNNLKDYIDVAYCAEPRMIKIFFTAQKEHQEQLIRAEQIFTEIFAEKILSLNAKSLAEEIICLSSTDELKFTLSTAESCSGGLIGGAITTVSGSSEVYKGGIIAYSNEIKTNILNVDKHILEEFGAVSEEVAKEMVINCKKIFLTDCAISVTGIAGPTGGSTEKPVGLVYIGIMIRDKVIVKKYNFRGDRVNVRWQTVQNALADLRFLLKEI